jgi:rubredoxin/uncharacterized membrane protein
MKTWKCTVCGYTMQGEEPPDVCPVCGAEKSFFKEAIEEVGPQAESAEKKEKPVSTADNEQTSSSQRQWKCTICGYIHTGDAPPATCPVCGADSSFFIEVGVEQEASPAQKTEDAATSGSEPSPAAPRFGVVGELVMRLHLHPISVHIPNGVLPIAMVFLVLAMIFGYGALEKASFFNMIVVLLSMPAVAGTGFIAWQRKYRGAKTPLFITKLVCAAVVAVVATLMVFWRIIDTDITLSGGIGSWIYLGLGGLGLAAAGIAGHLGGKLVFDK